MTWVIAAWVVFGPSIANKAGYNKTDFIVITATLYGIQMGVHYL